MIKCFNWKEGIKVFILLFLIWLIFNNYYALDAVFLEIVLFGLVVCALIYLFIIKLTPISFKKDIIFCKKIFWIILYLLVLLKEVMISNIKVLMVILNPKDHPNPEIVSINVELKSQFVRTLIANSITLTPGTITISLQDDKMIVHCLKKKYIEGFENSLLVRIAKRIER